VDIRFVARNIEVPEAIEKQMREKLLKLEKFYDRILDAQVRVTYTRGMHVVEITLDANGTILRGEEYASDLRTAFEGAIKIIERRIKKHKSYIKDRAHFKTHDVVGALKDLKPATASEEEKPEGIVRVKRISLQPMTPQEAAMQMELLGHDFFLFEDADSGNVNVVYRRKQGGYGLIEPQ